MTLVLDASVATDIVLGRPRAAWAVTQITLHEAAHAPDLLVVEVLHVLRRHRLRKLIAAAEAQRAVGALRLLPVELHPMSPLTAAAWGLTGSLTAYDAMYVALAQALGATLLTTDDRLARGARRLVSVARP